MPIKTAGFIYLIVHIASNRKYIGRKLIDKAHSRQKNKKIIRSRIENDWKDYWGSSPELTTMITKEGIANFTREILVFAPTKGLLNYLEERILYSTGSMESAEYINSNIRAKMFKRNIIYKLDCDEINLVINSLNSK